MIPLSDPDITRENRPYITMGIIGLNGLVFLYELTLGSLETAQFFYKWGFIPLEFTSGEEFESLFTGIEMLPIQSIIPTWATAITSMFMHGGFMHFGSNMLFLWVFGDNIEDRLGHIKFILFYISCGIAAILFQVATNGQSQVPNIGASGAIAGVLGAYLVLFPYSRINTLLIMYFITIIRIPAVFMLVFWFILQFFGGIGSLSTATSHTGGVAYWAHVGGFLAGVVSIAIYLKANGLPILPRRTNEDLY